MTYGISWRAYIQQRPWLDSEVLHVVRDTLERGKIGYARISFEEIPEGGVFPDDNGILKECKPQETREFLQAICNAAWEIGIKPSQIEDQRNELNAVRYHLEDMRTLAKLRTPSPTERK